MKKLILALALCAFAFASCGDDDENGGNNGNTSSFDGTITGTMKKMNWNDDSYTLSDMTDEVDEIYVEVYNKETGGSDILGKTSVANGKFTLKLSNPSPSHLEAIGDIPGGVTVSDKAAKTLFVNNLYCSKDGVDVGVTRMRPANQNEYIRVSFTYADRDFTIKGTMVETDKDGEYTTEYNVNMKKG